MPWASAAERQKCSRPKRCVESSLSLYYFHLRDGADILLDPDGREFESIEAIQRATLVEARSIISCDAIQGLIRLGYHIDVEDRDRQVVHSLHFEDAVDIDYDSPVPG